MPETEEYLTEALRYEQLGVTAYKIHPSGDWRRHMEISEAVREAVPNMVLMLDPALSDYTLTQAVKVGRKLEALDFHWLEEPFYDSFVGKYADLTRTLDISICATEASYGGPSGVAEFLRAGAADIVRADVSWKWGVTGTLKTLHLAESFGINCELHTTLMGLTDIANLHVAVRSRIPNTLSCLHLMRSGAFPSRRPSLRTLMATFMCLKGLGWVWTLIGIALTMIR